MVGLVVVAVLVPLDLLLAAVVVGLVTDIVALAHWVTANWEWLLVAVVVALWLLLRSSGHGRCRPADGAWPVSTWRSGWEGPTLLV